MTTEEYKQLLKDPRLKEPKTKDLCSACSYGGFMETQVAPDFKRVRTCLKCGTIN